MRVHAFVVAVTSLAAHAAVCWPAPDGAGVRVLFAGRALKSPRDATAVAAAPDAPGARHWPFSSPRGDVPLLRAHPEYEDAQLGPAFTLRAVSSAGSGETSGDGDYENPDQESATTRLTGHSTPLTLNEREGGSTPKSQSRLRKKLSTQQDHQNHISNSGEMPTIEFPRSSILSQDDTRVIFEDENAEDRPILIKRSPSIAMMQISRPQPPTVGRNFCRSGNCSKESKRFFRPQNFRNGEV